MTERSAGEVSFAQTIESNQTAEYVSAEKLLFVAGNASMMVRRRGGFITECSLQNPETGELSRILFCGEERKNLLVPKLTASHAMMPVGPSEGVGGQHGFPRWADYGIVSSRGDALGTQVALQAEQRADHPLSFARQFELTESCLASLSMASNNTDRVQPTSLGEHYYFDLPGGDISAIKFDYDANLDELIGEGTIEKINKGEPQFLNYNDGLCVIIEFPDKTIRLEGHAVGDGKLTDIQHGMLIWRRPGSPSICFEPTIGYSQKTNEGIDIPPYGNVGLITTIDLVV